MWRIFGVSKLLSNADLGKGLLSSNEEVTIDRSQCKSSRRCMNCVCLLIDVGGGSSETEQFGKLQGLLSDSQH